jgi:hypothetical protein
VAPVATEFCSGGAPTWPHSANPHPFSLFQAIRNGLAEAQRVANGNGTEAEKAEAAIEVSVFEALQASLKA